MEGPHLSTPNLESVLRSKIHADCQNDRGVGPTEIEHVSRKVDLFVGEACQHASLNVERRLVGLGPLNHQACPEPVHWGVGEFRPSVEEISGAVLKVKNILTL